MLQHTDKVGQQKWVAHAPVENIFLEYVKSFDYHVRVFRRDSTNFKVVINLKEGNNVTRSGTPTELIPESDLLGVGEGYTSETVYGWNISFLFYGTIETGPDNAKTITIKQSSLNPIALNMYHQRQAGFNEKYYFKLDVK